jgi:two-component system NtrC family sensor kinase
MSILTVQNVLAAPERVLPGQRSAKRHALRWSVFAGAAALVGATLGILVDKSLSDATIPYLIASTALLVAAVLALRVLAYRRGIAAIHQAVLNAQEGLLDPASMPAAARRLLGPVVDDYNLLIKNFGSLFREMEQCQLWIIGERNRHDAILRSLPGVLFTVDGDFRVTLSNKQAQDLFGRVAEDLLGQNLFELLRLDEAGREVLREAFLYEQQVCNQEIALTVGDVLRHFTLNLTFFKSQAAAESSAVIVLQDITGYKQLQELTHQTEKLVAMGQLAAGVAHELNTPLGTIIGYAQLLNTDDPTDSKRQHSLQVIYAEAKRCARIVDNLLAYARRDRCQPASCDINHTIRDVVETVNCCQGKRYNVEVDAVLDGNPVVRGDPGQLDIVLVNLVMNALQATARATEPPRVTITSGVDNGAAIIAVTDNGPGVEPALRSRVFDPFFTTKEPGTGTGLGLAISQSIVSKVGGTLRYEPGNPGGARFVLTLPLEASA